MADVKLAYSSVTDLGISMSGLANNAARSCTAVDNSANKYIDAIAYVGVQSTGTPASDKAVYVWFYGSHDGTEFTDNSLGTDAAVTMRSPTNLRGPHVISLPDAGTITYKSVIGSVASFFGGILPPKWGIVVENKSFGALVTGSGQYVGAYYTSV